MQLTFRKTISLGKSSTVVVIEKGVELLTFMIHLETAPVCCVGAIEVSKRFQVERQIIPCRGIAGIEVNYLLEMLYRFARTLRAIVKYSKLTLRVSDVVIEFARLDHQLLTLLGFTLHYQDLSSHPQHRPTFPAFRHRPIPHSSASFTFSRTRKRGARAAGTPAQAQHRPKEGPPNAPAVT